MLLLSVMLPAAIASDLSDLGGLYNASHLRLVDHDATSGNWLFRGGIPILRNGSQDKYAYDALLQGFAAAAANASLTFPKEFHLVDLCLLTSEKDDISLISNFFKTSPQLGEA